MTFTGSRCSRCSGRPKDALGFDLAVLADGHPCAQASGNVVLVAHGVAQHRHGRGLRAGAHQGRTRLRRTVPRPAARRPPPGARAALAVPQVAGPGLGVALAGRPRQPADRGTRSSSCGPWSASPSSRRLRLPGRYHGIDEAERAEHDASALSELLARADRLLAGRRRRLEFLARLAERTGPLEDVLIAELAEDWGRELTASLAAGHPGSWGPAATAMTQDPRAALPVLQLTDDAGGTWAAALDLIGAAAGRPDLRRRGERPGNRRAADQRSARGRPLSASYWVGNGTAGNAEAEAINALVWAPAGQRAHRAWPAPPEGITGVRNPLPASGGIDAETVAAAKLAIPGAFTAGQQRALTTQDYVSLATDVPGVRRAAAELRGTGTLTVVDVAIQPEHGEDPTAELMAEVRRALAAVRKIGHLVRVMPPRYRPLVVALDVTLSPGTIRREAAHHLARVLSSGWLPDGSPALFNPVNLAFAAPVYSSPLIAAVHAVAGVASVTLTRFGFLDQPAAVPGPELRFGTLEIARLDNDPTHPEHGYALVSLEGGR